MKKGQFIVILDNVFQRFAFQEEANATVQEIFSRSGMPEEEWHIQHTAFHYYETGRNIDTTGYKEVDLREYMTTVRGELEKRVEEETEQDNSFFEIFVR